MITDVDVKKLSKVFTTKDDLKFMERRQEKKFDHIDTRFGRLETKVDKLDIRVGRLETKVTSLDTKVTTLGEKVNNIDKNLTDLTNFVVPALGRIFEWTDDIHRAIVGSHKKLASDN